MACVVRGPAQKTAVEYDPPAHASRNDHREKIPVAGGRPTPSLPQSQRLGVVVDHHVQTGSLS
ncbi:uncharacterized protein METZ01_LOCUS335629 [marine metagenome]|uniref:Uncharacterized protein n=1 Tax=marine metagenome TaxID=408172 RepID=A0A382QD08_9ZZZZ